MNHGLRNLLSTAGRILLAGAITLVHCVSSVSLHAQFVNDGQAAPPAAGAVAGVTGQSYGEIRASRPGDPVPGANATVAGANSHAWAANSVSLPVGNIVGLSGYASANAGQPDPKSSAAANSAAVIAYQASAPGTFDLNLRAFMSTNYRANARASWHVEIYDAAQLSYSYIGTNETNFPPGCEPVTLFAGYEACINFVQAAPLPFPYETVQLAAVVGGGGNNCQYEHMAGDIAIGDCTITSNGLAMLSDGVDGPDTFKFTTSSTYFVVALNASASAGPSDCLYYYKGCQQYDESQPLGNAYVVVDPVIVPDPVNPDIVITSTSGPNPNPNDPLIPSNILASLDPDKLSALVKWGITPNSQTPPPTTIAAVSPVANPGGWNNRNVAVTFRATDSGGPGVQAINFTLSGAETGTGIIPGASGSVPVTAEGITTLTYFAEDTAGNKEAPKTLTVQIDKTPPTITATLTPTPNANGWNNTPVRVHFACSDALSGVLPGSTTPDITVATEGRGQTVSGSCQDVAGNKASATVSGINIDETPPVISGLPLSGCTLWPPNHKLVEVANVTATDALSGVAPGLFQVTGASSESAAANGSGNTASDIVINGGNVWLRAERSGNGAGRVYTVEATASDLAGNVANASGNCVVPHDQGNP